MTNAKDAKADKAEAPKKDAVEEAPKQDEAPAPVVDGAQNPEGIDLTAGDKDAATAYQED